MDHYGGHLNVVMPARLTCVIVNGQPTQAHTPVATTTFATTLARDHTPMVIAVMIVMAVAVIAHRENV